MRSKLHTSILDQWRRTHLSEFQELELQLTIEVVCVEILADQYVDPVYPKVVLLDGTTVYGDTASGEIEVAR